MVKQTIEMWIQCINIGLAILTYCTSYTFGFVDICKTDYLDVPFGKTQGIVGVTTDTGPIENYPCILRIKSCSNCHIQLHPVGNDWELPQCPSRFPITKYWPYSLKECTPGCSYLFMFDSSYMNETLWFYKDNKDSNWGGRRTTSLSSAMFIGLCSHQAPPNISLEFNVMANEQVLWTKTGQVRSVNFPSGYWQNGDRYTWVIRNVDYSRILVVFDDWHISPFSEVFFDDSDRRLPINGASGRSTVLSKGPEMKVTFITGNHLLEDQNRYIGFKFSYTFYKTEHEHSITIPLTDCGKYDLISAGGVIDFQMINSIKDFEYDCVWVVKKQPDYDRMYMKIMKFRTDLMVSQSNQVVEIRDGLTSDGTLKNKIYPNNIYKDYYKSETGFYIRFRGKVRPMDNLQIVYTSYRERGYADCKRMGMFYCSSTGRCIPSELECDRFNHCGDNSDENGSNCQGGGSGWSRSSNYSMTVSVIVPLVISVFFLIILCVLFFLIRRCHNARALEMDRASGVPTISGGISSRRGRRNRQTQRPAEFPPTYEEALDSPPYEEPPLARENGVLKPPTYDEAIGQIPYPSEEDYTEEEYPPPDFSTLERPPPNNETQMSNTPSEGSEEIRPVNHTYSMSYSSESSTEVPVNQNVSQIYSPTYTEVPYHRSPNRESTEHEFTERVPSQARDRRQIDRRTVDPQRHKNNEGEASERNPYESRSVPAISRRGIPSQKQGHVSERGEGRGKADFTETQNFPNTSSSRISPQFHSKGTNYHKGDQVGNQTKSKTNQRDRTSDSSSKNLLFSEDHCEENRGILNQAFKDYDSSQNSPPKTNSASLANLHSLERWTEDRRGMAMSLQHLPITQCVASRSSLATENPDHSNGRINSGLPIGNARREDVLRQPRPLNADRPMSLSVGNLPIHSHLQPRNLEERKDEGGSSENSNTSRQASASLGDLTRRQYNQAARRQTQSHPDLSNIQEERNNDVLTFVCDSEDVFV